MKCIAAVRSGENGAELLSAGEGCAVRRAMKVGIMHKNWEGILNQ